MTWTFEQPTAQDDQVSNQWTFEQSNQPPPRKKGDGYETEFTNRNSPEEIEKLPWYERLGYPQGQESVEESFGSKTFEKGALSGLTFGASENIDSLKAEPGEESIFETGKFAGQLPILHAVGGLYLSKLGQLTSPIAQKIAPTAVKALTGFTASVLTGATAKAGEEFAKGEFPTQADLIEHGATWGILHAALGTTGQLFNFSKKLFNISKDLKVAPWETLSEISKKIESSKIDPTNVKAISDLASKELEKMETGYETLSGKKFDRLVNAPPAEPTVQLPKKPVISQQEITATEEILANESNKSNLDKIAPEPLNTQVLTESVQDSLNQELESARNIYTPLYEEVTPVTEKIMITPDKTIKTVQDVIGYIESLKTRPEGYNKVLTTAKQALIDLGVHDIPGKYGKTAFQYKEKIPLSTAMELAKRLNKVADYDLEGAAIKKQINKIVGTLKRENLSVLEKVDPSAAKKISEAEQLYGDTAEKFGRDSITKIRNLQKLEQGSSVIQEPTTVKDLKNILQESEFGQVERNILKKIQELEYKKALPYYREVYPYLSGETRQIAESTIKGKKPLSPLRAKAEKLKGGIKNELQYTQLTGESPKNTLKLWKTEQGRKVVKETLRDQPAKKELFDYLNQQTFHDFASDFLEPNGTINFKALEKFTRNPEALSLAKEIGGKEAEKFIKNLNEILTGIKKNTELLDKELKRQATIRQKISGKQKVTPYGEEKFKQKVSKIAEAKEKARRAEFPIISKAEDAYEKLGINGKTIMYGMLGTTSYLVGGTTGIVKGGAGYIMGKMLLNFIKNPATREAWRHAAAKNVNPLILIQAIKQTDKIRRE